MPARATATNGFVHCGPDLDEYIEGFTVPCLFEEYDCAREVMYQYHDACAYAPCTYAVTGCAFKASQPMLFDHLTAEHPCPVHVLPGYWRPDLLRVPMSESGPTHQLLVVNGDELRLFVMSVRTRGTDDWGVMVACVQARGVVMTQKSN